MEADTESRRYGEELFRLLVETVADYAIFAMDPAGRIVHWNAGAARVTGFRADEVLGTTLGAIFTAEDAAAGVPEQELRTAAATGRAEDERWHVRKDGVRFWAQGVVVPLRAADGTLLGFGKVLRDRTDLKELQEVLRGRAEALLAADERKNVFLATLAHELRGPLAPLANAAHLLRTPGAAPDLPRVAALIDRQVAQLQRLVDDLLDVARIQRGKVALDRRRVSLGAVVDQAVEAARPLVEARQHVLTVVPPPAPVEVDADPGRLVQVFVNLLGNAAKFTDPGGRITVTLDAAGGEALARVHDTGDGIPPDQLGHIFELFAQAPTPSKSGGLGIGLALVRDLVALHGGTVQARSDGPGLGSEFTVRLPLAPA